MNAQANQLRRAVEERKRILINRLQAWDYFHTPDGKNVETLTLTELEQVYENVKFKKESKGGGKDERQVC